jgi:two-component system, NtrC family, sensor kinase
VILLACSAAFILNNLFFFKKFIHRNLESTAKILGQNLTPTLAFSDKPEATKILSSLKSEPSISSAYVLLANGSLFAQYGNITVESDSHYNERSGVTFDGSHAIFSYKLSDQNEVQGFLYLNADLKVFLAEYKNFLWIVVAVFVLGLLMSLILAHFIQRALSQPITLFAQTVQDITESGNYSLRMKKQTYSRPIREIETLSEEFNQMLNQIQLRDDKIRNTNTELELKVEERTVELKEIQEVALQNAHSAGMAEIATGILHNIGNIMNSITTSANEITQVLQRTKMPGLLKANKLLEENVNQINHFLTEDSRGKALPEYYLRIGESLSNEQQRIKEELMAMSKKIVLIKDVIHTQQEYAKTGFFFEELSLAQVTDEILEMQRNAFTRHAIKLIKHYGDTPPVKVQRVKLAHILVNLIKNSKEAMQSKPPEEKQLTIEIGQDQNAGIFLKIKDTGEGIPDENLKRIFNHGFTTKQGGHGFGLHFCANAMTEMGGHLDVKSEGIGKGVSFTLIFPNKEQQKEVKYA